MSKPDPRDPEQWIPRDLFAAYCGEGSHALIAYFDKARAKRNAITMSFDLFALLLLPAWLGYRRQWTLWGTLVGMLALLPFLESAIGFTVPNGAFAGMFIAMSFLARGFLLSNANALFWRLKRSDPTDDALREALRDRAAPSVPQAIAGGVGGVALPILSVLLADSILGMPPL